MLSAHLHVLRIGHDPLRERVEVAVSRHALHLHRHHGSRFVLVSGGHLIRESSQIPIILSIKFQGESSKSANDRKSRYKYVVHVAQCVTAERQSALAPPVRFPCDQGRDRRGGAGTWRMAPPRVRAAASQCASNRIKFKTDTLYVHVRAWSFRLLARALGVASRSASLIEVTVTGFLNLVVPGWGRVIYTIRYVGCHAML